MSFTKFTLANFVFHFVHSTAHGRAVTELVYDVFRTYFSTANAHSGNANDRRLGASYTDVCTRQCSLTSNGCFVSAAYSAQLYGGTAIGDIVGKMASCAAEAQPNTFFNIPNQTLCDSAPDCVWNAQSSACEPHVGWVMHTISSRMSFDGKHCGLLGDMLSVGGSCRVHNTQDRCMFEGALSLSRACVLYQIESRLEKIMILF